MLIPSLSKSLSASVVNGIKQLPNRWLIAVLKKRGEMRASLYFSQSFPSFHSRGNLDSTIYMIYKIVSEHVKWTGWGLPNKVLRGFIFVLLVL